MSQRKKPSLTDILARFQAAQQKAASEEETGANAENTVIPESTTAAQAEDASADVQNTKVAQNETIDAKEALQAVADAFIDEHNAALKKEAQIFGELFAVSCMEHMNKTASIMDAEQQAYDTTLTVIQQQETMLKQAATYDTAYMEAMAQIAGYESVEAFQKAAGLEELAPEDLAAMMAEQGRESTAAGPDETPPSIPEQGSPPAASSVTDALESVADAAESNAGAIQAIAEAVQLLAGIGAENPAAEGGEDPEDAAIADSYVNEDGDVNLEDIQNQAYANVLAQLGG